MSAARLAELEQTLENLTPSPGDVGMDVKTRRLLDPLDELELEQDELMDLVERRGGLPSSRSKAVSGFGRRPAPRIPGPLGATLKIADLLRRVT